jgi:hypothetical protein
MGHQDANTAMPGREARKATADIASMLARAVRPSLVALAICGLGSVSAFADECPGTRIAGTEFHGRWRVRIDIPAGTLEGTSVDGRHLTADINVTCVGAKVTMRTSNKSDGNDCTYILSRDGRYVSGDATCTKNTGVTDFHGMFQ